MMDYYLYNSSDDDLLDEREEDTNETDKEIMDIADADEYNGVDARLQQTAKQIDEAREMLARDRFFL
jgi:TATA-binding protein-associated factor Taf7